MASSSMIFNDPISHQQFIGFSACALVHSTARLLLVFQCMSEVTICGIALWSHLKLKEQCAKDYRISPGSVLAVTVNYISLAKTALEQEDKASETTPLTDRAEKKPVAASGRSAAEGLRQPRVHEGWHHWGWCVVRRT